MTTPQQRLALAKMAQRYFRSRTDLATFIQTCVRSSSGAPVDLAPIHLQWIAHTDYCWRRGLRSIIIAPFGHGKTSSFAVPLIAWELGRDHNRRFKVVTNDDGSATKRVNMVKKIVESGAYRQVFPEVRKGDIWTNHELYLRRPGLAVDPNVHARGIFTTGIGGRADDIIFDDVVDQRNTDNPDMRSKVMSTLEETWMSRLEPSGRVLYIGTLWHLDDATHHLMSRPGWCTLIQRTVDGPTDELAHTQEVLGAGEDYPDVLKPGP